MTLGAPNASGRIDATVQIGRVDANGVFLALNGAGFTYSGVRSSNDRHIERLTLSDVNAIGSTDGRYTVRVRVLNQVTSAVDLLVDDIELTLAPYSVRDVTSDYIVRWYRGTEVLAANLISGQTSRVVSTLPDGTYTAEARLTGGNNCPLVAANTVTIGQTTEDINVQVREVSPVTSCTTSNGSLSAGVSVSGMVTTMGYTFTWYETSELATPVATGSDATGLSAVSYTVRVTDNSTGCVTSVARAVTSSVDVSYDSDRRGERY